MSKDRLGIPYNNLYPQDAGEVSVSKDDEGINFHDFWFKLGYNEHLPLIIEAVCNLAGVADITADNGRISEAIYSVAKKAGIKLNSYEKYEKFRQQSSVQQEANAFLQDPQNRDALNEAAREAIEDVMSFITPEKFRKAVEIAIHLLIDIAGNVAADNYRKAHGLKPRGTRERHRSTERNFARALSFLDDTPEGRTTGSKNAEKKFTVMALKRAIKRADEDESLDRVS